MDSVLFDFGFFQLKWYSFFIFMAVLTASFIIIKEIKKKNIKTDMITDILFYGIIIGILGARIYYVLFNLNYYHGGIIATLIFLIIYTKKKKINLLLLLDVLAPAIIIAQTIGRWGNFFNQEAYGRIVSLEFLEGLHLPKFIIDNMYIGGYYREPTFLYESVFSLIGFIVIMIIRRNKKTKTGQLAGIYFIWYGVERLIIETFRSDSLMLGPIKVAQLISIISCIVGIYLIFKNIKSNKLYKEDKIFLEN